MHTPRESHSGPHLTGPHRSTLLSSSSPYNYGSLEGCSFTGQSSRGSLPVLDDPLQYPHARRDESVVDNYHGVLVVDPYQWLEDPVSEESKAFVEKQVELMESVLKTCETRDKLRQKITELSACRRYEVPFWAANKYFCFLNTGLQPQSVLYVQDGLDGNPEVLLDPNTFSEDGTVALTAQAVSEDAKYLAYGISSSGSDWVTVKVL
ncbi:hypothetical protein ACH5RR_027552 [Cinchona calisaya]|uniref:Peptidase S9A N-terminal domain-containing protein n=1 Tax=Cinchona calisaya TaxID=153742 RepID=A0ABD2Z5U7_9GENT